MTEASMSSVKRGDAFESRVFSAIENELQTGALGLNPATAKMHAKKGYFSRDREADIVLDISIEVWLPGADRWSFLWAIECKDYSKPIPVDDLEEFKAKLDQITGANRKGVFVTSAALQRSAINYAKAHGMGVIRILPDNQVTHVFYQMPPYVVDEIARLDLTEFNQALTIQNFQGQNRKFYGDFDGDIFGNWPSLARRLLKDCDFEQLEK